MSARSGFPEIKRRELPDFLEKHPNAILFIKGPYDTSLNRLMKTVAEAEPGVGIAWMAKDIHTPPVIEPFSIEGAYNAVIFRAGVPVKRLTGLLTLERLLAAMGECFG